MSWWEAQVARFGMGVGKKRKIPTNVVETVELAQKFLRLQDVFVDVVPSSEVPVNEGGDAAQLSSERKKAESRVAELESVEIMSVPWDWKLMDEANQLHAEEFSVWKETFRENADNLINDVRAAIVSRCPWNEICFNLF